MISNGSAYDSRRSVGDTRTGIYSLNKYLEVLSE